MKILENGRKCADSLIFILCNYFTCVIDIFAIFRHIENTQIYCNKFTILPCYIRVAPKVALDLRLTT